jgi:hypothetical protein
VGYSILTSAFGLSSLKLENFRRLSKSGGFPPFRSFSSGCFSLANVFGLSSLNPEKKEKKLLRILNGGFHRHPHMGTNVIPPYRVGITGTHLESVVIALTPPLGWGFLFHLGAAQGLLGPRGGLNTTHKLFIKCITRIHQLMLWG